MPNSDLTSTAADGVPAYLLPEPLPPAQVRARRAQRLAVIRASQRAGLTPQRPIVPRAGNGQPARLLFAVEDVPRCSVAVSPAAREVLAASTSEGRLFTQALEEVFGAGALAHVVACVQVDLVEKGAHFSDHPDVQGVAYPAQQEHELVAVVSHVLAQPEAWLLRVRALPTEAASAQGIPAHDWLLNVSDFLALHPANRHPLMRAVLTANELLRLYPYADAGTITKE